MTIYRLIHNSAIYNTVSLHLVCIASRLTTMMLSNVYVFVFFICCLVAFGRGLDDDFADMKQMIGKLFEENEILRNEVASIRGQCGEVVEEKTAILRSEVESIIGQCGEENAILRRQVESMKDQIENKVDRHELRDEVDAINFRLEGAQEGNSTF